MLDKAIKQYDASDGITPAQMYRTQMPDDFDSQGTFYIPMWILEYLPLLGGEAGNKKFFYSIQDLLNKIPNTPEELTKANVYINMIILLVRIKRYGIVIL